MLCQWGTAAPGRYPDNRWANPSKAGLCLHRSHQHRVEGRITHLCSAQSPDGLSAPFPNPLLAFSQRDLDPVRVESWCHEEQQKQTKPTGSTASSHLPHGSRWAASVLQSWLISRLVCNSCPQSRLFIRSMLGKHLKSDFHFFLILFHYYYWGEKAMKCFGLSICSHLCVFVCSKEGAGQ